MRKYLFTFFIVMSFVCLQNGLAQNLERAARELAGEINLEAASGLARHINNSRLFLIRTEKEVNVYESFGGGFNEHTFTFAAPPETKIVNASFKADNRYTILILLSNGGTVIINWDGEDWYETVRLPNATLINAQKIVGDALYILKQGKVYVSRDTAKTWKLDSVNIGQQSVLDITVDTSFYAWAITQNGNLYYQHPDSNVWRIDTSFIGDGFPQAIFIDRKGRMFISTYNGERVWMSTNKGVSWTVTSTGITESITKFGDDAFGNIYAVGSGSKAYRLSNLTLPWKSIGDSINAQAYLPLTDKIINSISGDTVLYAATRYGMFQSTDFGANWIYSPSGLQARAHKFYAGVVKAKNYYFVSGSLGIYRVAAKDTVWEKVWPKEGFAGGVNVLSSDSAGNVYANLPFKTGLNTSIFYNVKSTDFGNSWIPDTAGYGSVGINTGVRNYDFRVDRQGTQYLGGSGIFLTKKPGQSWRIDTSGLGMQDNPYSIKAVSLNNKKGITYVSRAVFSGALNIYSKAVNDSAWKIVNTSSLAASDGIMLSDQDGNIMVKAFSSPEKLWRYNGSIWTQTPLPIINGFSPSPYPLTVDRNGVIWAVFTSGGSNEGVYFTSDNGTTWKYVGLKGVGINFLNAVDDTTSTLMKSSGVTTSTVYAVTFIDGIYGFTTATIPTSVGIVQPQLVKSFELFQNYPNPFNPTTNISFSIPKQSLVTIKIFDILGREVAVVLNEEKKEGIYSVPFNASKLSSGLYLYRLYAGDEMQIKKMMLLK